MNEFLMNNWLLLLVTCLAVVPAAIAIRAYGEMPTIEEDFELYDDQHTEDKRADR